MAASNFKEARAENQTSAYGPFLQTDHFAETITVRLRGGPERQVVASVIEPEEEIEALGDAVAVEKQRAWFKVLRDETADKGGIERAEIGLAAWREGDDHDNPWACTGRTSNETPATHWIEFERNRPRRYGPTER